MFRRIATHLFIVGMVLVLIQGSASALAQDPTIPTRTPTPDPNAPTSVPPPPTSVPPTSDSGGGSQPTAVPTATNEPSTGNPPAAATATTEPGVTATTAPGVTPTATVGTEAGGEVAPGGTFVVQECGTQPYVAATRDVIVFTGPGIDYPVLSTLQRPEIRPIIGRAEFAPWWYIQLTPDLTGWVADSGVDEFGDTGGVPLVDIPALNGIEPTRGALWQPTPIPFAACTATPTPTPSPSPTATATAAADASEAVVAVEDGANGAGSGGEQTGAVSVADIAAAGARGEAEFESNSGATSAKLLQDAELAIAEATGGQSTTSTPLSGLLFPLLGMGLIGAGLVLALMARSRNSAAAAGTEADSSTSD